MPWLLVHWMTAGTAYDSIINFHTSVCDFPVLIVRQDLVFCCGALPVAVVWLHVVCQTAGGIAYRVSCVL